MAAMAVQPDLSFMYQQQAGVGPSIANFMPTSNGSSSSSNNIMGVRLQEQQRAHRRESMQMDEVAMMNVLQWQPVVAPSASSCAHSSQSTSGAGKNFPRLHEHDYEQGTAHEYWAQGVLKLDDPERIAQVLEIVESGRLPAHLSEMDPVVVKALRSYFRNTKPTPACPRSPCPNPANTAFRSLNNPGKTLLLQPVFDCRSCKHRFTLNGRLRTAPIRPHRPHRNAGNRQAAPDRSWPASFSCTTWAEQHSQASGQIPTHNHEYGLLQQLRQQQKQQEDADEQDLILNYCMELEQQLLLEADAGHNIEIKEASNNSRCAAADGSEYTAAAGDMEEVLAGCSGLDDWTLCADHDCMMEGSSTSDPVNGDMDEFLAECSRLEEWLCADDDSCSVPDHLHVLQGQAV